MAFNLRDESVEELYHEFRRSKDGFVNATDMHKILSYSKVLPKSTSEYSTPKECLLLFECNSMGATRVTLNDNWDTSEVFTGYGGDLSITLHESTRRMKYEEVEVDEETCGGPFNYIRRIFSTPKYNCCLGLYCVQSDYTEGDELIYYYPKKSTHTDSEPDSDKSKSSGGDYSGDEESEESRKSESDESICSRDSNGDSKADWDALRDFVLSLGDNSHGDSKPSDD